MDRFKDKSLIELATLSNDLGLQIRRLMKIKEEVEEEIDRRMYIKNDTFYSVEEKIHGNDRKI